MNYKNVEFHASLHLFEHETCQTNGTLITSNLDPEFDKNTGTASFYNLRITKKGMYLISVKVKTNKKEAKFECLSKPILIRKDTTSILANQNKEQNIDLTFNGNSKLLNQNSLKINEIMLYNCIINENDLNLQGSITFIEKNMKFKLVAKGLIENFPKFLLSLKNVSLSNEMTLNTTIINKKEYNVSNLQHVPSIIQSSQNNDTVI